MAVSGSGPATFDGQSNLVGPQEPPAPDSDTAYWKYLGQQDFFVAAKLAIFEESFVKNTINIGNNPGSAFANIVLAGGRLDPYIALGQSGTVGASGDQTSPGVIGYDRPGIFMGMYGTDGSAKPVFSIENVAQTNAMLWDGENLIISGSLFAQIGSIGGWTVGATTLSGGSATLNSAGSIFFTNGDRHTLLSSNGMELSSIVGFSESDITHEINFVNYPFGGFPSGASTTIGTLRANIAAGFVNTFEIIAADNMLISAGDGMDIYAGNGVDIGNPGSSTAINYISGVAFSTPSPGDSTTISRAKPLIMEFNEISIDSSLNVGGTGGAGYASNGVTISSTGNIQISGYVNIDNYLEIGGGYGSTGTTIDTSGNIETDGYIRAGGNITAFYSSDERLKLNLRTIENPLDKVLQIGGYTFDWDETKQNELKGHDVGVIAQQIKEVLPEVVTERKDGYLAVRYEKIVPLLIESIKELSEKVDELEKKLNDR
jgi:hypothetical protein